MQFGCCKTAVARALHLLCRWYVSGHLPVGSPTETPPAVRAVLGTSRRGLEALVGALTLTVA